MHLTDAIALKVYTVVLISSKSESKKFVITQDPLLYISSFGFFCWSTGKVNR